MQNVLQLFAKRLAIAWNHVILRRVGSTTENTTKGRFSQHIPSQTLRISYLKILIDCAHRALQESANLVQKMACYRSCNIVRHCFRSARPALWTTLFDNKGTKKYDLSTKKSVYSLAIWMVKFHVDWATDKPEIDKALPITPTNSACTQASSHYSTPISSSKI